MWESSAADYIDHSGNGNNGTVTGRGWPGSQSRLCFLCSYAPEQSAFLTTSKVAGSVAPADGAARRASGRVMRSMIPQGIRVRAGRVPMPGEGGPMRIGELWRYPVKSMAGEPLEAAEATSEGIVGDRIVHVEDGRGRVVTSRTRPRLLGLRATLGPDGQPRVDGQPWTAPAVAAAVRAATGDGARLVPFEGPERFDVLPLLVATDGAVARFGHDRRRLRPNIVITGVEGLAEREWAGRRLRCGEVLIDVVKLRARCVMTTFDPDTLEQDVSVLRRIVAEFGGTLALDCAVARGGRVAIGDPVELL